jgi:hypothetical protein
VARKESRSFTAGRKSRTRASEPTNHDPAGFVRGTKRVRVLIDTLFHRDRDKQQAAALWAAGARDRFGWR